MARLTSYSLLGAVHVVGNINCMQHVFFIVWLAHVPKQVSGFHRLVSYTLEALLLLAFIGSFQDQSRKI